MSEYSREVRTDPRLYIYACRFLLLSLSSVTNLFISTLSAYVIRNSDGSFRSPRQFQLILQHHSKDVIIQPLSEYHAFYISARRLVCSHVKLFPTFLTTPTYYMRHCHSCVKPLVSYKDTTGDFLVPVRYAMSNEG